MKLIVGLGNPGRFYARHRHNIGYICLNHFARRQGIKFDKKKGLARIGQGIVAGNDVVLARPQTYMNESGKSVGRLTDRFDIDPNDLIVIQDDLDLPLAKIRIGFGKGSGGHKGIRSIIQELGVQDFVRLRVGIGRPNQAEVSEEDIVRYVLSDFTPAERRAINSIIPTVDEALLCLISEGLTPAMNKFN
ncbi:MAG: aminoacyl-tRNA hydrolase [Dehalococcoidia bacterium]|jgi:PTH1 family peptidyl-tRNA hydrolase